MSWTNTPPVDHQGHMDVQIHKGIEGTDGQERGEDQDHDFSVEQESSNPSSPKGEIEPGETLESYFG